MKNYCYICGKELSNDGSGNTVRSHKEHIIHNGIYGRLKSSTILCEQCGNAYSKSDAEFVDLFKGFIDLLSNELYSKNHGTEKKKKIRAYLNPNLEEQVEVEYYNGKTYPLNPYYIVDEEKEELTLYANQNRMKAYEKYILKENPEYATYSIRCKDNLTDDAQIGLFFSEQNPNFNQVFKSGMAKIATEFALHSGIKRNDIKTTLTINDDGTCSFDTTKTPIIPYSPHTAAELLSTLVDDIIDTNYPSHILRLFVDETDEYRMLLCYIELFSTFKYYVVLNMNYNGESISNDYAQRIMKTNSSDGSELPPSYILEDALKTKRELMIKLISDFYSKHCLPDYIDKLTFKTLIQNTVCDEGLEQLMREIKDLFDIEHYAKHIVYHYEDANPTILSAAGKSLDAAETDLEKVREYTFFKFNQFDRFCWNYDKIRKTRIL